jgi:cation:H+ antiporter
MWPHYLLFTLGFLLLYFGAAWLVKGASALARRLGISSIVIGLTVVAFGTSAPEMVVSVLSSVRDKSMIAVGNAVGSNICNIALVLGAAAFLTPLTSSRSVIRRDIPLMLGISVLLFLLSLNSHLGRGEGIILFAGLLLYSFYNYRLSKHEQTETTDGPAGEGAASSLASQLGLTFFGIAGVLAGAQVLIDSALAIMKNFGVNEKFIGLTVVALGTSLPELATSIVAAIKKEMDISIGNLIGSNVFNILGVVGLAALVRPIPIPGGFFGSGLFIDYLVMIAISFLPWLFLRKKLRLNRAGGAILLVCYVGYIVYLMQKSV